MVLVVLYDIIKVQTHHYNSIGSSYGLVVNRRRDNDMQQSWISEDSMRPILSKLYSIL